MKLALKNFDDVADALVELGKRETVIAKKEADMNKKLQEVKDKFMGETLTERTEADFIKQKVEEFCLVNKAEFQKVRSKDFAHGVIGYRNNPPKVTMLNRKYNIKTVLELLKRIFKGDYIRSKEEIDKEAILASYSTGEVNDAKLASVGLKIDQDETFFIDIKWDTFQ